MNLSYMHPKIPSTIKAWHKYGQRYDTSMRKNCQWKLDNFFYHYAPTSSWVLKGLVQTMSIVRNLNTFKMGSVVDLFEGVSIWLMLALVTTTLISMVVFYEVHSLVTKFWWTPLKLRKTMEQQGWKGPKFSIFVGNMPEIFKFRKGELSKDLGIRNFDIMSQVYPQYVLFSKKYGKSNHWPS